ncbi:MAG: hypothetical protein ICV51_14430, partial [Flavisolibacter sp.]|nr:hypothetical protein [Flavisolibacter sp.]
MRKYTIILALLLINIRPVVGQTARADSINRLLAQTTNDTGRIDLLTELAYVYQFYKPDSSLIVLKQAVAT